MDEENTPSPAIAEHPGGDASMRAADDVAQACLERSRQSEMVLARSNAALERSRRLRRLPREPLFMVPLLMAIAHALGILST